MQGDRLSAAMRHLQAGRPATAAAIARELLARRPHDGELWNLLGAAASELGETEPAREALQRAVELAPDHAPAHYNLGRLLAREGRLEAAIERYERALTLQPRFVLALNNLGNALRRLGRLEEAIGGFRRALRIDPDFAQGHNNLGGALHDAGRLDDAIACYRHSIVLNWNNHLAHRNLGLALRQRGDLEGAAAAYGHALALAPDDVETLDQQGVLLFHMGQAAAALAAHERALALHPQHAPAHNNRGNALDRLGRLDEAEAAYRQALALRPDHAEAHCNLGRVLLQRGRPDAALGHCEQAVRHGPKLAAAHAGQGEVLRLLGELQAGEAACRRALALKPDWAEGQIALANALADQGRAAEAASGYRRAIALEPKRVTAHGNLAKVLLLLGELEDAIAAARRAIELDPDYAPALSTLYHLLQQVCAWDELPALGGRLDALIDQAVATGRRVDEQPFAHLARSADPARNLLVARSWSQDLERWAAATGERLSRPAPSGGAPIRIGYLAADFQDHPIAHHMQGVLRRHDRSQFEVVAYSYGADDRSAARARIVQATDRFVDLRPLSIREAAGRIAQDRIDLLVDLTGYMRGHRLGIAALRPAPLQATLFGFPGSTGAEFFDYALVDRVVVPPEHARFYTERLVWLPTCYQPNDYPDVRPAALGERAAHGLPERGTVFASFNQAFKIDPILFGCWMEILHAVPGSVLWLHPCPPLAVTNLRAAAAGRGIAPERLIFAGRVPLASHLSRLALVDVALDTRTYGGGSTTSNALWAGVPVIALEGTHFASRMGASLLQALGMPQLIVADLTSYRDLAIGLAREPQRRASLRAELARRRGTSPLFDAGRFTRELEAAYRQMLRLRSPGGVPPASEIV